MRNSGLRKTPVIDDSDSIKTDPEPPMDSPSRQISSPMIQPIAERLSIRQSMQLVDQLLTKNSIAISKDLASIQSSIDNNNNDTVLNVDIEPKDETREKFFSTPMDINERKDEPEMVKVKVNGSIPSILKRAG